MPSTMTIRRLTTRRHALALGALALGSAGIAHAGLGDPVESVARDHAQLGGRAHVVTPLVAYDLHDISTADGTHVREYVSRAGTVFGVTFEGPSLPDLSVVLGSHYGEYTAAAALHLGSHRVVAIDTPGLVLSVVKRPRGFSGHAHLPALLPAGTNARDLR